MFPSLNLVRHVSSSSIAQSWNAGRRATFQAQIELLFAEKGRRVAVLTPQGDASSFNLAFLVSPINANRVEGVVHFSPSALLERHFVSITAGAVYE